MLGKPDLIWTESFKRKVWHNGKIGLPLFM
jgi:hypothetical protein